MVAILFVTFAILLVIGVPVSIALFMGAGAAMLITGQIPLLILVQKIQSGLNNFSFMAIPLFLIAGNVMAEAKISDKLVSLASLLVGRYRGGLSHISTGACAFFGAISGSAPATTAAIGSIMIPSMEKRGYGKAYSAAVLAASGVLGLIIPPSLTMVVYGVTAGVSIGTLFMCGFVPGVIITLALMVLNYYIAKKNNIPIQVYKYSGAEIWSIIKGSLLALFMPVIILGGIYAGIFTPTESAAVACLYGIIIGLCVYRTLTLKSIFRIFVNSIENIAMIFLLIASASIFGFIIAREGVPAKLAALMLGSTSNHYVIMIFVMIIMLILGTFLDNIGSIVLIVPTLMGVVQQSKIDPIYFGMFVCISLAVGQITPPVGLNLFIASNISGASFESVAKNVMPYIGVYILLLILFIFVPQILTVFA